MSLGALPLPLPVPVHAAAPGTGSAAVDARRARKDHTDRRASHARLSNPAAKLL